MEGYCSTGQSPQWAVVPMEEKEEERSTKRQRCGRVQNILIKVRKRIKHRLLVSSDEYRLSLPVGSFTMLT